MRRAQARRKKSMSDERALKVSSGGVLNSEAFQEASREELRVLVAVMDRPYAFSNAAELAEAAGVSRARAASAIALFTEAGIFMREGDIGYEFSEPKRKEDERTGKEVAGIIRNNRLAELYAELTDLMGKDAMTNGIENRGIASLVADYGLTADFILILATYIKSKGTLTVDKLVSRAKKFEAMGINTAQRLEEYIKSEEKNGSLEWEFRHTFRRYSKPPQEAELDIYRKWTEVYGFSSEVVKLALDINVKSKSDYSYSYMDALLTRWHECGCRSTEECKAQAESDRARMAEEMRAQRAPRRNESAAGAAPKFGDFDPDEALTRAISRSYGKYEADEPES